MRRAAVVSGVLLALGVGIGTWLDRVPPGREPLKSSGYLVLVADLHTHSSLLSGAAYAVLPERLVAMQGLAAVADLLAAGLLAWLLARIGSDPRRSVAIAWSPIGALHFAHSGHNDAIMVAALVAAPLLLTFGRRYTAFVALGLATATKGLPAFVVPAFVRAAGWRPLQ